ncbi:MAG: hypothetical protein PUB21_00005, partial [Bacteroidales bacterium]|nr:hypothetical protein [Bacteroidales bacterium]
MKAGNIAGIQALEDGNITDFQYFTPAADGLFCGDPMPFSHDSVFHVYWLLDREHAAAPLGGHIWAHSSTDDLKKWTQHPIALGIDREGEGSMCTGSVFYHDGIYYAFYATRSAAANATGKREVLSVATSRDGIHFDKWEPLAFLEAPKGYADSDLRDPFIFRNEEDGRFYMIVTALSENSAFEHAAPCLIYYVSDDLKNWEFKGRFYTAGSADGFAHSECADYFKLGKYYYLLFKVGGGTYYRIADSPLGPWRSVMNDNIGNDYALVFKTAPFKGRRIATGFIPWREGNRDDGGWQYGGSLVFRELKQKADGSLVACFVKEMQPEGKGKVIPALKNLTPASDYDAAGRLSVVSDNGFGAVRLSRVPVNSLISFRVVPEGTYTETGILLRDTEKDKGYYDMRFIPKSNKITLGNTFIDDFSYLSEPFTVEIVMKGSVIDACINGERCIVNRVFDHNGECLTFYVRDGKVRIENLRIE